MDWCEFHGGRRRRGNGRCGLDSIKEVFCGVEGEEDGENGDRQDDKKHTEEQSGNEKFPRPIGTEAKPMPRQGSTAESRSRKRRWWRTRKEPQRSTDIKKRSASPYEKGKTAR
jgi:hypothetical protein